MQLPRLWLETASAALPDIARDIIGRIRAEIPEYGDDPSGQITEETRHAVREALRMFMAMLATGATVDVQRAEIFRRLGRLEAYAGRSHDTLQSAYRIASQSVMHQLLTWEREHDAPREAMAQLSTAVFEFIDELATLSAEGFADGHTERVDEARARTRLIELLVHRDGYARRPVTEAAARIGWTLPSTITVVELVPEPGTADTIDAACAALLGADALCGSVGDRWLAVVPGAVDLPQLRSRTGDVDRPPLVVVGPTVPLVEAGSASRLVQRLRAMHNVRARAVDRVVACAENMVELVLESARDTVRVLNTGLLEPLIALSPAKRVKYGRLLSAWLEFGTLNADEPGVLDKHRQTLRYQCTQLEKMFGDALHDRRSRLEIMIALRAALPVWERQTGGSRAERSTRTDL